MGLRSELTSPSNDFINIATEPMKAYVKISVHYVPWFRRLSQTQIIIIHKGALFGAQKITSDRCLERLLRIRMQLAPFQWTRELCMATLTVVKMKRVTKVPRYDEYKGVRGPEINKRLSNSWRTSNLESRKSRVWNLSK